MKRLNLSPITDAAQLRLKAGSIEFIQTAAKEAIGSLARQVIGATYSEAVPYILQGCVNTGTGSNYVISAGSVLYGGEVYQVDAVSFTVTGANIPVLNIVTTNDEVLDPVTLTDSSTANVHKVSKVVISAGLSGSGLSDYSSTIKAYSLMPHRLYSGSTGAIFENSPLLEYTISLPITLHTTNYFVRGSMVNNDSADAAPVAWFIKARTTTSFTVIFRAPNTVVIGNIDSFEYELIEK